MATNIPVVLKYLKVVTLLNVRIKLKQHNEYHDIMLCREEWAKKKEIVRKLGPGKYENHRLDSLHALESKPVSSRGVCSTREKRFRAKHMVRIYLQL